MKPALPVGLAELHLGQTRAATGGAHQWQRKGYKVFGAIEYFSGRLFSQGLEGRCNSEQYQVFLRMIMAQTPEHLFVIHDGARYHTSASTQAFWRRIAIASRRSPCLVFPGL